MIFHMVKRDVTRSWTGKHARDSQLASDSHKQVSDTAAASHSRISWLESLNSRVGISREASSRMFHPRLSIASDRVASTSLERVGRCIWAVLYLSTKILNEYSSIGSNS